VGAIVRSSLTSLRRFGLRAGLSVALSLSAVALSPLPANASDRFTFTPSLDTYVSATAPNTTFGRKSYYWTDAQPVRKAFMRFDLTGISGREVTGVHLHMYQLDASTHGGDVHVVPSSTWTDTITFNAQPAISPEVVGSFDAVAANTWYQIDLSPSIVTGDGPLSLAITSSDTDGAKWSSREGNKPPELIVDVAPASGLILDGLSTVANWKQGSSQPTYFATNHRLVTTRGGRLLAVHGWHLQGVQLAWRDPASGWQTGTEGDVPDGLLLSGTGTGDWSASIALAADSVGDEHAWVVWAGATTTATKPLQMRRLSDLDDPAGPTVGPLVTIEAPGPGALGEAKPDLAFEAGPSGPRGAIVWTRHNASSRWDLVAGWFTDLDTDAPTVHDTADVISSMSTGFHAATLAQVTGGLRIGVRSSTGKVQLYTRSSGDPLTTWTAGASGVSLSNGAYPSAVGLSSGEVLAAMESDTTIHTVTVERFSAGGNSVSLDLSLSGYAQPSIASDGSSAWLVMIRRSDGLVVSRSFSPVSGWDGTDRVEIGPEAGGNYAWPNLLRTTDGRLRFVVRGARGASQQNAVLAFQRVP
jgi:hypothetical protein